MSLAPSKLTKRQRKALAHRDRHKNKGDEGPINELENAVPELDILDIQEGDVEHPAVEALADIADPVATAPSKKRKRSSEPVNATEVAQTSKKRKASSTADQDTDIKKPRVAKSNRRYILFVGNLSYKTGAESIAAHFTAEPSEAKPAPKPPNVRLLTQKVAPGATPKSRTKGCAFIEFPTASSLQAGLKLHHSELDRRRINVELTAGGGGASEKRREKVVERNKKLMEERLKSDPTPRPPANYGFTTMRHSTTSGSTDAPTSIKTWKTADNGPAARKKVRGAKKPKTASESANPPDTRWATGANAMTTARGWGGKKA